MSSAPECVFNKLYCFLLIQLKQARLSKLQTR